MTETEIFKLDKSPLIIVLAQVRFSPVLTIEDLIPQIQELLRKTYPGYEDEQVQELQFSVAGKNVPRIQEIKRWVFSSADKKTCIILTQNFVCIEVADHKSFNLLSEKFGEVLDILEKTVGLLRSEKVGLRYVNLIRRNKDKESEQFLKEGMRGLTQAEFENSSELTNSSISHTITPYGRLLVRAVQLNNGTYLPPELSGSKLNLKLIPDLDKGEKVTVLDIDHSGEFMSNFKSSDLLERLNKIHGYIRKAFKASVTSEAISLWS